MRSAVKAQLEDDGELHRTIYAAQHIQIQLRRLELDGEDLKLRHIGSSGQVDRFRSQLVLPDDLFHLLNEQVFQPCVGSTVFVDLVLWQVTAKSGLLRVADERGVRLP
ncbi:hypothetical protein D3C86_1760380 [compost metagenome]